MGAHAQTIGLPFPGKDRRRGGDRRKRIDPRYRNPSYPQFVDRRQEARREPTYEDVHPFVQEHPHRKWIMIISVLVVIFLTYLFFFTNILATNKTDQKQRHQGTIVLGRNLANDMIGIFLKKT
jgi:hypothetical protein